MRLASLRVQGYRCLEDLDLPMDALTAVIGANGTGKSSVIRALEFLFGQANGDQADVTANSGDCLFEVTATLTELSPQQRERYGLWLSADGTLVVGRRWSSDDGGAGSAAWFCRRRSVVAFTPVRSAGSKDEVLRQYDIVRADTRYPALLKQTTKKGALAALDDWEESNPSADREEVEDDSLRFGPGGAHDLRDDLDLLVVPAVRDATADATEARGSNLGRLTAMVLGGRQDLGERLASLQQRTEEEYLKIVAENGQPLLEGLQDTVSAQLGLLAPGTNVRLEWQPSTPVLGTPTVRASIVESGHAAEVGRQGHGVQRAYVFALLRALVDARRDQESAAADTAPATPSPSDTSDTPSSGGCMLVVVEEPELYQHPLRSQHLAHTLSTLASDPSGRTQVLYATHSPHFAGVERLRSVRLFRMHRRPDGVATTRYSAFDPAAAAARLEAVSDGGTPWTPSRLLTALTALLETPVSEGLFARAVLLVEGDEDRGALLGTADHLDVSLTAEGIAVIPVRGKDNMPRALVLYEQLGVPAYVVFDGDTDRASAQDRRRNLTLTRLLGAATAEELPATQIHSRWACISTKLMAEVRGQLGTQRVDAALARAAEDLDLDPDRSGKNGVVIRAAVRGLAESGHVSSTLVAILESVRRLPVG